MASNRFVQEDGTIEQRYGGTGLGLNIVQKLVQLFNNGSISVESEKGKGTTFSVILPVDIEEQGIPTETRQLLVVDDTPEQRWLIWRYLKDEPLSITYADTGLEAVNVCKEQRFDLILLDIQIPLLDGFDTLKEIRRIYNDRPVPVIAFSGSTSEEDRNRYHEAGFDDHLGKPFNREQLKAALHRHLV